MAKVLYITANPNAEERSFSLSVGREFINAYREANAGDEVVELDLYNIDLPFIDAEVLGAWGKLGAGTAFTDLSASEQAKVGRLGELVDQFVAADKYVIVTPMWNLSIPPKMKMYIDAVSVAGKTFKYTENGPVGLLAGKPAVHIQARGGAYSEGPAANFEFGDSYIKAILSFYGITELESIIVEGQAYAPQNADSIKANAIENARVVARRF